MLILCLHKQIRNTILARSLPSYYVSPFDLCLK